MMTFSSLPPTHHGGRGLLPTHQEQPDSCGYHPAQVSHGTLICCQSPLRSLSQGYNQLSQWSKGGLTNDGDNVGNKSPSNVNTSRNRKKNRQQVHSYMCMEYFAFFPFPLISTAS
jgi:hypothetical protein